MLEKVQKRIRRHIRVRARISGSAATPRLAVYRSNAQIYAQLIDDVTGKTICSASDMKIKTGTKTERASQVGTTLAELAVKQGITACVFDRGGFLYMGRVAALADGAREGGLKF